MPHTVTPEHSDHPASTLEDVPLDQIGLGDETQARVRLDPAVIAEYAEAITEGATFPPVVLFSEGDLYWIGDGYHRIEAARQVGSKTIKAEVRPGAKREALLHACGANTRHGLRMTNADKRKAVAALLRDEEWGKWSDNHLAQHCGVSQPFVSHLRASLKTVISGDGQRTYLRQGREQSMDTSNIGAREVTTAPMNGAPADDRQAPTPPVMAPEVTAAPTNGAPPAVARRRRRPDPTPLSADQQQNRRWDLFMVALQQFMLDFSRSGGLEPLLAVWTPEERLQARDQLRRKRDELDRLDAAIAAEDAPDEA